MAEKGTVGKISGLNLNIAVKSGFIILYFNRLFILVLWLEFYFKWRVI